jgi:hypothetical protein
MAKIIDLSRARVLEDIDRGRRECADRAWADVARLKEERESLQAVWRTYKHARRGLRVVEEDD